MKRGWSVFSVGVAAGVVLAGVVIWNVMPSMMLTVHKSKLGFDATVAKIESNAAERGWLRPKIYNIQATLQKAGHTDMSQVKIISLCQPHHAYDILEDDANKKVTAVMPCRVGVYEGQDGQVYISEMNIGLMGKMFGGKIAEVMAKASQEEKLILADIIQP